MNYPSIRIEGAILSPDILERIDDMPGQKPGDFGLESTAKVKDEIARAWADAQDYWRIFRRKLETLKPDSPATTETRQQWIGPLLGLLGYQVEYQPKGAELNGKIYNISHRATNRAQAPVQIVGYREPAGLDRKPERANLRMSAHAVVQEYLNLNEQLYGIVTNGRVLRLLRDSSRLVKLSYLEFDLDRIFTDGLFADFAILYRLLHATRLPVSNDAAAESLIERYHQDSLDSGARIRNGLSRAVEQAIRDFGNGFLAHPANKALQSAVVAGTLTPEDYYKNLLRLIYRLLFLMVIEERDLVFPPKATAAQRNIYASYYSVQRLRILSEKRYLADHRRHDLWLALTATFRLFEADGPGDKLGLAPLAGDLFGHDAIGPLAECSLGNDVLLSCLRSLSLYEHPDNRQLIRVNYAALNVEEFGSVYEGLLEYEPVFTTDGNHVEFGFKPGDDRSATGSHYTPDELVQPLIKHSLDCLITERLKAPQPEAALLDLRVADIACGSGHILLAAARRIATEIAVVRTGEEQPSPTAYRTALRDVIRNCIYGVDLNPLAVELCKVALWLEAHNPGQPLNFLDHHIRCGNAIVGFAHREELDKGVPDEAFVTMPGDDKAVAAALRKQNKEERKHQKQMTLDLAPEIRAQLDAILTKWKSLSALPERTPAEIEAKKRQFTAFAAGDNAWLLNQIAAIPIAQFYLPKTLENAPKAITDEQFRHYWKGEQAPQGQGPAMAWATANRKRFFHWFLEFPEIVARGGFDCLLGNPPYLGDKKLRGQYGASFVEYCKWAFPEAGANDLVVYFIRRLLSLLATDGILALLTTSSVAEGDIRDAGLRYAVENGLRIHFAVRSQRWPGQANVSVAQFAMARAHYRDIVPMLNQRVVRNISCSLTDDEHDTPGVALSENADRCFTGYYFLGDGFLLDADTAEAMLTDDVRNAEVIAPFINGDDLNSSPIQRSDRHIINFRDMSLAEASAFQAPIARVRELVKPYRATSADETFRDKWWRWARTRPELRSAIAGLAKCIVTAQTTKYLSFSLASTKDAFGQTAFVIASERWDILAMLQGSLHEMWALRHGNSLGATFRYAPSRCFETFPFPQGLWRAANASLAAIGERYHEHRRALMLRLWLGLTSIYNLFHIRDLTPSIVARISGKPAEADAGYEGILQLRTLHRELNEAILAAYGWAGEVSLGHDFHEIETLPENDRVRYTISPAARQEILKRLLAENHARAQAEAAAAATAAVSAPVRRRKKAVAGTGIAADMGPLAALYYPATDRDKAICAALLAAVEQASKLDSMDHLDVGLLATHPAWCKVFLAATDQKRLDAAVAKAPAAMFVGENDSIRWKDARDYLEQHRNAVTVDHTAAGQPITADVALAAVKATLPDGVDEVVAMALKAAERVSQLRSDAVAATKEQQRLLALFRQEARSLGLAIA